MKSRGTVSSYERRKFRIELPNMLDDGKLDVYEFRLLVHYFRRGHCYESVRTTAQHCQMSHTTVIKARNSLEEKGFIRSRKNGKGTVSIHVVDRWEENYLHFVNRSGLRVGNIEKNSDEESAFYFSDYGSLVEGNGNSLEQDGSPLEPRGREMERKEKPINKNNPPNTKPEKKEGSNRQNLNQNEETGKAASASPVSIGNSTESLWQARNHPDLVLFRRVTGRFPAREQLTEVFETIAICHLAGNAKGSGKDHDTVLAGLAEPGISSLPVGVADGMDIKWHSGATHQKITNDEWHQ
ncbi:MAG: hypothetical protein JXA19_07625 [Anaerolineales bacterium]|nr:hypothetical protein [Anaerolineales bacterium]